MKVPNYMLLYYKQNKFNIWNKFIQPFVEFFFFETSGFQRAKKDGAKKKIRKSLNSNIFPLKIHFKMYILLLKNLLTEIRFSVIK